MKKLIMIIPVFIVVSTICAQNNMDIVWQSCYGGSEYEAQLINLLEVENGYFLLGSTESVDGDVTFNHGEDDLWLISMDNSGNILWEKCYGGSSMDNTMDIIYDNNGYYYLGGWTWSNDGDIQSGNHGGWDRWVVKINAVGDTIWEKCYGGSYSDYPSQFLLLENGNILVYSATSSNDGDVPVNYGYLDVWLTIINPDGELIQNKVFGNDGQNNIFDIVQTSDGGYFFTSSANTTDGMVEGELHGWKDVWAVKLDSMFNIEWQKLYGGSDEDYQGNGIIELEDGYFFIAQTNSNDGDVSGFHGIPGDIATSDIWAVKIDLEGNIVWERCLGGSKREYGTDIFQDKDGGFVIVAETGSHNGDIINNNSWDGYSDIWMVKISAEGEVVWSECYGGLNSENIYPGGVLKKADDNYLIGGLTEYASGDVDCNIHGGKDIWLFEIKDCSQYQPATPQKPTGKNYLCVNTDSITTYTTQPANGAWYYEWEITPQDAGIIETDNLTAQIHWEPTYEGTASIKVRSSNDCGTSAWSDSLAVQTYMCLGTEEYETGLRAINVFPNPASSTLTVSYKNNASNKPITIELLDIYGSIDIKQYMPQGKQQLVIDVTDLAKSLYLVRVIESGEVVGVKKIIVE